MDKRDTNDFWEDEIKRFEEVRNETQRKHKENFEKICCILDNWVDLLNIVRKYPQDEVVNSISALFLLNAGKQLRWVTHEILCGAYFEAIRDLRYVFEVIVWAYHVDIWLDQEAITVFGVNKGADMSLKYQALVLKDQIEILKRTNNSNRGAIKNEQIEELIKNVPDDEKETHRRFYSQVLGKLVNRKFSGKSGLIKELPFENYKQRLNVLYSELSKYTHFSHKIIELSYTEANWDFVFNFSLNKKLLDTCTKFLIEVMDVFYAVLYLKFEMIRSEIENNVNFCELHNISFPITKGLKLNNNLRDG